jgi:hypothetical protein
MSAQDTQARTRGGGANGCADLTGRIDGETARA